MRMELIAALLHGPEVLLLDEPTIGLDVVSQRRVQEFLRYYQAERKITVLLTSHYMKDVEALCQRAIIINHGKIHHDGPLAAIVDRFSRHKIMDLQFTGEVPTDLGRYGVVVETRPPRVRLEVPRQRIPEILTSLLANYSIEDIGVQERPLEDVIAEMFASAPPRGERRASRDKRRPLPRVRSIVVVRLLRTGGIACHWRGLWPARSSFGDQAASALAAQSPPVADQWRPTPLILFSTRRAHSLQVGCHAHGFAWACESA